MQERKKQSKMALVISSGEEWLWSSRHLFHSNNVYIVQLEETTNDGLMVLDHNTYILDSMMFG